MQERQVITGLPDIFARHRRCANGANYSVFPNSSIQRKEHIMPNTKPVPTGAMSKEPAAIIGSISAAIVAVLGLLTAFGFDLTAEQTGAIVAAFSAIAIAVQTIMTRNAVYAPSTVQRIANEVSVTGDATIDPPPANSKK